MLTSPRYKDYIDDTIKLARSIVVKTSQTIDAQNNYLIKAGGDFSQDKTTWRYYKNIAGEYHYANTKMYITSSDTRETILFDKDTLIDHPITRAEYAQGTDYYKQLMDKYPNNKLLIPRILNPVDMQTAIDAEDFTILWYDKEYIYDGEVSLMNSLQDWVNRYCKRWNVTSFHTTDFLYPSAFIAQLYMHMVTAIINIRLELARTAEADDFHIWAFLGSRYRLDQYREELTYRQAAYLYRNIDYLRHHSGKEVTIDSLLTNITEPADIFARKYDIALQYENYLEERHPQPIYLEADFKQEGPNRNINARRDPDYIYDLTAASATYNQEDIEEDLILTNNRIKMTQMNILPTGIMELYRSQPYSDIIGYLHQTRIAYWIFAVSKGLYKASFNVSLGDNGNFRISAEEGLILLCYCIKVLDNLPDTHPPVLKVLRSFRLDPLNKEFIDGLLTKRLRDYGATDFYVNSQAAHNTLTSGEDFRIKTEELSFNYFAHRHYADRPEEHEDRSFLRSVVMSLYPSEELSITQSASSYQQWLELINFPYESLTHDDYVTLTLSLLKTVAYIDVTEDGIGSKSRAMVDILKLLTAYNITLVEGSGLKPYKVFKDALLETAPTYYSIELWPRLYFGTYGQEVSNINSYRYKTDFKTLNIDYSGPTRINIVIDNSLELINSTFNTLTSNLDFTADFIGTSETHIKD